MTGNVEVPAVRLDGFSQTPGPLYQKIKSYVRQGIADGTFAHNEKLPSEQEFVRQFGVARMTVHRALRELTAEGALVRMPGVGTFVREPRPQGAALELRDIREEIRARGNAYACEVIRQERVAASREVCEALHLPVGETVYHGLILHRENGSPAQLEERFIVEAYAAGFLEEDLRERSLYSFLRARSAPSEIEHIVEAGRPEAPTARLLELNEGEPILAIRRRTWVEETVAVLTRFTYPGDRYFVVDRHRISSQSRLGGGDLK